MSALDFNETVKVISREDPRYDVGAYHFVRSALDQTVKEMRKSPAAAGRTSFHVTGPELLEGIRKHALEQYGPLAITVLEHWRVTKCADFGEIVFNLIEYGLFSKTENDRREDFSEVFTFEEALAAPFRPSAPRRANPRTSRQPRASEA